MSCLVDYGARFLLTLSLLEIAPVEAFEAPLDLRWRLSLRHVYVTITRMLKPQVKMPPAWDRCPLTCLWWAYFQT